MQGDLAAFIRFSLTRPRDAAAQLLAMNLPDPPRWMGLALVAALSTILSSASLILFPPVATLPGAALFASPLRAASLILAFLVVASMLVQWLGSLFGGTGIFRDALLLVVWWQFLLVLCQAIQIALLLVVPPLTIVTGYVFLILALWLATHFIAELHGFTSAAKVFVGIIAGFFLTVVAISLLAVMMGLTPPVRG
ncbi:MAG: Yip1 family protein [Paracoccaceae bacterium]